MDLTMNSQEETRLMYMLNEDLRTLDRLRRAYPQMELTEIPGMEGLLSRIGNTIVNMFKSYINHFTLLSHSFEAMMTQDWVKYIDRCLNTLRNNLPSDEQFSGTVCWRAPKHIIERNLTALRATAKLLNNFKGAILSKSRDEIPTEIANVIRFLEQCDCTIDVRRPSSSKAATRFTYGELGRLGTQGYGSDVSRWLGAMSSVAHELAAIRDNLLVSDKVTKQWEEIEKIIASEAAKGSWSNNLGVIKARSHALRAAVKAAFDLWDMTLTIGCAVPIQRCAEFAGMKDDIFSWIFATKNS